MPICKRRRNIEAARSDNEADICDFREESFGLRPLPGRNHGACDRGWRLLPGRRIDAAVALAGRGCHGPTRVAADDHECGRPASKLAVPTPLLLRAVVLDGSL